MLRLTVASSLAAVVLILRLGPGGALAQGRDERGSPPPTPRATAPVDLTGYWEAVVTEDWRYRMLPPLKLQEKPPRLGEVIGIPMNGAARNAALAWDPAKDEAAGGQCKAYGAPNIMRIPGRVRVTWRDEQTLKLETDAGIQTRLFEFGTPQNKGGDWQGVSQASWDQIPLGRGSAPSGSLKVVTTKLRPGYLMKNGIPYSANAIVTVYYERIDERSGESYLLVTTTVEDPVYLTAPYTTSTHFKRQADASGWNPAPCTAR